MATSQSGKSPRGDRFNGAPLTPGNPRNSGGKKGRSGRKPDAFKEMCQELSSSAAVERAVRKILKDPTNPAFIGALKWASEHGYGRPTQPVDLRVTGSLAMRLKLARERAGR